VQERILNTRSDYDFAGESPDEEADREKLMEGFKSSMVFDEDEDAFPGSSLFFVIKRTSRKLSGDQETT
jgi:hypothetical protein